MPDEDRTQFEPVRSSVVIASAAAGLERPIGPVRTSVDDLDWLRATSFWQLGSLAPTWFEVRSGPHP